MKLFVGGISGNLDDVDLKEMFELYGDVQSAMIVKDKATGKGKGFGFVDMPNDTEAKEAMELLDGVAIFGKKIGVKEAGEEPRRQPQPNRDYRSGNSFDNRGSRPDSRNSRPSRDNDNERRRY